MPITFTLADTNANKSLLHSTENTAGPYSTPGQFDPKNRFTPMGGGLPVTCRASIVRVCFMKLLGTGLLAAYMATSLKPELAYSCALAAGVNFVACAHYFGIWSTRAQVVPLVYSSFASTVGGDPENDAMRLAAQELAVDGWRSSDWTVTLVLMTLDMWKLARHANNDTTAAPIIDEYWCATLQPVIIFLGSIPRFYLNDCRSSGKRAPCFTFVIGGLAFLFACGLFGLTSGSLIEFVWRNGTPPDTNMRLLDARVITGLMLVQIGYPIVYLYSFLHMHCFFRRNNWPTKGNDFPAWLSLVKDLTYCTLDITTKAGLALYVSTRALYII
jgi:hypothetical protein